MAILILFSMVVGLMLRSAEVGEGAEREKIAARVVERVSLASSKFNCSSHSLQFLSQNVAS